MPNWDRDINGTTLPQGNLYASFQLENTGLFEPATLLDVIFSLNILGKGSQIMAKRTYKVTMLAVENGKIHACHEWLQYIVSF